MLSGMEGFRTYKFSIGMKAKDGIGGPSLIWKSIRDAFVKMDIKVPEKLFDKEEGALRHFRSSQDRRAMYFDLKQEWISTI